MALHRPGSHLRLGRAAGRVGLEVLPLTGLVDRHQYMLDQESGDPSPVGRLRRGRLPDRRQFGGRRADRELIHGGGSAGGRPSSPHELRLYPPPGLHRLLPAPLQLAGHQAVLRLARPVLPIGPLGLELRPLAPQLPVPRRSGALPLDLGHSRRQAGRRVLHAGLCANHGARRLEPVVFQQVRPAAGAVEPVQRRDLAVHRGMAAG